MTANQVQVLNVWPGIFGGSMFSGRYIETDVVAMFKAGYKVMPYPPRAGEFLHIQATLLAENQSRKDNNASHPLYSVDTVRIQHLPSSKYINALLLRHAAFRGFSLGKSKIKKLIDAFGADELVKILNNSDTALLSKVINILIAEKLVERWSTLKEDVQLAEFLTEHQFDWNIQRHIVRLCRSGAVEKLKSNPYALVYFSSISKNIWRTVEDCAVKLGIPKDSEARLNGAIELALYDRLAKGHTSTKIHKLIELSEKYTGSNQLSSKGLTLAINKKSVCLYDDGDIQYVQLTGPAVTELMLEKRLSRIWADKRQISIFGQDKRYAEELGIKLKQFQISNRINLNKKQEVSVIEALTNRLSITTGFGGTGKTTILKAIADLCEHSGRTFNLLAYSGKAADRIRLSTGRSAQTIHLLIQSLKTNQLEEWTESDPLLIIDESSMVEPALLNKLLSYFDGKSLSLLMVGDPAQLSPVGWGIAWHTLTESKSISITHLTDVYRTDNEALHGAAMAVRAGEVPDIPMWKDEAEGIYFVESHQKDLKKSLLALKVKIPECNILSPHSATKSPDSCKVVNKFLQRNINTKHGCEKALTIGATTIRPHDPVIVTENNYDLGLFNGTTGTLTDIVIQGDDLIYVFLFEGASKKQFLSIDEVLSLSIKLAYAISVHKSQGSEYEVVIVACIVDTDMVERSLIYTALTRAKKLCIFVGNRQVFARAVLKPNKADTLETGFIGIEPRELSDT